MEEDELIPEYDDDGGGDPWERGYDAGYQDARYDLGVRGDYNMKKAKSDFDLAEVTKQDGSLDEMAFRMKCLQMAEKSNPNRGMQAIGGVPQQPEPVGEVIRRAQFIETYLREGRVYGDMNDDVPAPRAEG